MKLKRNLNTYNYLTFKEPINKFKKILFHQSEACAGLGGGVVILV